MWNLVCRVMAVLPRFQEMPGRRYAACDWTTPGARFGAAASDPTQINWLLTNSDNRPR
jgi:hypothetical protein